MTLNWKIKYGEDYFCEIYGSGLQYVYYNNIRCDYDGTRHAYLERRFRLFRYFERMTIRYGMSWRNFDEN